MKIHIPSVGDKFKLIAPWEVTVPLNDHHAGIFKRLFPKILEEFTVKRIMSNINYERAYGATDEEIQNYPFMKGFKITDFPPSIGHDKETLIAQRDISHRILVEFQEKSSQKIVFPIGTCIELVFHKGNVVIVEICETKDRITLIDEKKLNEIHFDDSFVS
jgi:hypothetical protein